MTGKNILVYLDTDKKPLHFLEQRIAFLKKPIEEQEADKKSAEANKKAEKGGVFRAFRCIFSNKDYRWLVIAMMVFYLAAIAVTTYYEPIMTQNGMPTQDVTTAHCLDRGYSYETILKTGKTNLSGSILNR
jgi:hypothetical protein